VFTGIIQEIGTIRRRGRKGGYLRLDVAYDEGRGRLRTGGSMAVDGVCLTATAVGRGVFSADLSEATQSHTTLGDLRPGDRVNLERPVTASDPLGGHIVLGHVDGAGTVQRLVPTRAGLRISLKAPEEVMQLLVDKGSIAVDGISLTVGSLGRESFEVFLIPETQQSTTLTGKNAGSRVNLEADYLAKLVQKFVRRGEGGMPGPFAGVRGED